LKQYQHKAEEEGGEGEINFTNLCNYSKPILPLNQEEKARRVKRM
jgi:hypothetical protein